MTTPILTDPEEITKFLKSFPNEGKGAVGLKVKYRISGRFTEEGIIRDVDLTCQWIKIDNHTIGINDLLSFQHIPEAVHLPTQEDFDTLLRVYEDRGIKKRWEMKEIWDLNKDETCVDFLTSEFSYGKKVCNGAEWVFKQNGTQIITLKEALERMGYVEENTYDKDGKTIVITASPNTDCEMKFGFTNKPTLKPILVQPKLYRYDDTNTIYHENGMEIDDKLRSYDEWLEFAKRIRREVSRGKKLNF